MKLILLTLAFALIAPPAHATMIDGRTIIVHPAAGKTQGRVILLHGFTGDHTFYDAQPANSLLVGLQAQGYQVLTPDLPGHGPQQATKTRERVKDGGGSYVRMWRRSFKHILRWANRRYGKTQTIVGGISWGGWHAMQAACSERLSWFTISPVVDPTYLTEFRDLRLPGMSLDPCIPILRGLRGTFSYGEADTRVGVAPQKRLGTLLSGPLVRAKGYPRLDHTTTPAAIQRVLRLTASLLPATPR